MCRFEIRLLLWRCDMKNTRVVGMLSRALEEAGVKDSRYYWQISVIFVYVILDKWILWDNIPGCYFGLQAMSTEFIRQKVRKTDWVVYSTEVWWWKWVWKGRWVFSRFVYSGVDQIKNVQYHWGNQALMTTPLGKWVRISSRKRSVSWYPYS